MAAEFKGRVPLAACLPSPIDIPALVLGMEGWMDLLLFDTENAKRVLERVNQFFILRICLSASGGSILVKHLFLSAFVYPVKYGLAFI